ncbi:hypothetical protein G7Y89_g15116 [Cudoniella acicularis]|uniref:Carboxylic ester hydrolase n=1 Tax=Cudoniella acicularis TaxID=354080 RepID=A0A8H4QTR7_9HELO|nr:hypothetical protein G7Y89_g15116 [Cudoniella acicularis]
MGISDVDLAYTAGLGFATVGANNGHNGTSGLAFYNNPDVVHDFADRSLHTGVVVGKQLTKQYYGTAHKKSYYLGCSTGGRQGFKAVQSYPNDFDGVVAGAPALAFPNLTSWSGHFFPILGSNTTSPSYIPAGNPWTLIHQEILNQCDAIDGVVDGIIEDPLLCRFRPEALLCPPNTTNTTSCLTSAQVVALGKVFEDFYGEGGKIIYPRMQPGSELLAQYIYYTGGAFSYTSDWFRYVVYNNPSWDPATFTIKDAKAAADQNPFNIMTWEGDLSAFKNSGGKVRHCSGGVGAHNIGQAGAEVSTLDPQNNVLLRMVDWVENGNAPETVTGTKYVNDDPTQGLPCVSIFPAVISKAEQLNVGVCGVDDKCVVHSRKSWHIYASLNRLEVSIHSEGNIRGIVLKRQRENGRNYLVKFLTIFTSPTRLNFSNLSELKTELFDALMEPLPSKAGKETFTRFPSLSKEKSSVTAVKFSATKFSK